LAIAPGRFREKRKRGGDLLAGAWFGVCASLRRAAVGTGGCRCRCAPRMLGFVPIGCRLSNRALHGSMQKRMREEAARG